MKKTDKEWRKILEEKVGGRITRSVIKKYKRINQNLLIRRGDDGKLGIGLTEG